jgi:small subunit ribosomal protein S20
MANLKSAIKKIRVDKRRRAVNLKRVTAFKAAIKDTKKAAAAGSKEVAKDIQSAYKAIDKAAKIKVIHPNKAARLKSRVAKLAAKAK